MQWFLARGHLRHWLHIFRPRCSCLIRPIERRSIISGVLPLPLGTCFEYQVVRTRYKSSRTSTYGTYYGTYSYVGVPPLCCSGVQQQHLQSMLCVVSPPCHGVTGQLTLNSRPVGFVCTWCVLCMADSQQEQSGLQTFPCELNRLVYSYVSVVCFPLHISQRPFLLAPAPSTRSIPPPPPAPPHSPPPPPRLPTD